MLDIKTFFSEEEMNNLLLTDEVVNFCSLIWINLVIPKLQ